MSPLVPFASRAREARALDATRRTCEDVLALCDMTDDDLRLFAAHAESRIKDTAAREAAVRNAGRVGLLVEELGEHAAAVAPHEDTWRRYMASERVDMSALRASVVQCGAAAGEARAALHTIEDDDASSSASDYSSSDTRSTHSTQGATSDDDDEPFRPDMRAHAR